MEALIEQARTFAARFEATKTLVTGSNLDDLVAWHDGWEGPLVLATPNPGARDRMPDAKLMHLGFRVGGGIDALRHLRDVILTAYVAGLVTGKDKLVVVELGDEAGHGIIGFDMRHDESVARLKKDLEYRADVRVVEAVLQVTSDLAKEGREKSPVGALIVVGDTERVMKRSRQVVLNPFQGHPPQDRNILDPRTHETVKEFCQIDGAIIVRDDGIVEAAGRYIEVRDPTDLPSGLGGRHLAAAAITAETKAIAVTCSETGVVRIFRDGKILLRIGVT